jgi:hypothetical protein
MKNLHKGNIYGMKMKKEGKASGVTGNHPAKNSQGGQEDRW